MERPATRSTPRRLTLLLFAVAAAAYGLDRVTKLLARHSLAGRDPVQVIPGVLQLNYTLNSGGAFSLGTGQPWLFFGASVAIAAAIVVLAFRVSAVPSAVGLGLVLGGATGNLTDRLLHGPGVSGRVIDFIDFHVWPVFNLADASIVIGAGVLILAGLRRRS
jgi:signal peptidase II